jgi:hypothetical protein
VINVTDRPDIYVRLRTVKLFLAHNARLLRYWPAQNRRSRHTAKFQTEAAISVVGIEAKELSPQLRVNPLQTGEIEFANLPLIGVTKLRIFRQGGISEHLLSQNGFKVPDAQTSMLDGLKESSDAAGRKRCLNRLMDYSEPLGVLYRKNCLLIHRAQHQSPTELPDDSKLPA